MRGELCVWCGYQHLPCHTQVNDPLPVSGGSAGLKIKDNVFSHAAHSLHLCAFQGAGDFRGGRLERLWLAAQPDGLNTVTGHALVETVGNCFYFREFRHGIQSSHDRRMCFIHASFFSPKKSCFHGPEMNLEIHFAMTRLAVKYALTEERVYGKRGRCSCFSGKCYRYRQFAGQLCKGCPTSFEPTGLLAQWMKTEHLAHKQKKLFSYSRQGQQINLAIH